MSIRTKIISLVLTAAVLVGAVYFLAGVPVRSARELWRAGRRYEAIQKLEKWSRLGLRRGDYEEMLSVVYLTAGKGDLAREHLRKIPAGTRWFPPVSKLEAGGALVSSGRYAEFLEYDSAAHHRREAAQVALYRAASMLGLGRMAEAEQAFSAVPEGSVDPGRYAAMRRAISQRREGSVPLVIDRNGGTIASMQVATGDLVALNVDFQPLIDREGGTLTFEERLRDLGTSNAIVTTLDPDVQRAALVALGGFRGSLVAIDPRSGEILAVANTRGDGQVRNLAFEQDYEPGSVVKVVTALNATRSGIDLKRIFPLQCGGYLVIDNRQFFDWAMHGEVPDLNDAMASSCNVAFGRIGLVLGKDRLLSFMREAGFGGSADLGMATVPLGRLLGTPKSDFDTANLAIGLQHETINALHLAMIGAAVANGGSMVAPRLIRERRTILGDTLPFNPAVHKSVLGNPASVRPVVESMKAAVTSARGTGRRAAVQGLAIALKTGTAGDSRRGFDSLIVAFAPADHPRMAIGMIAENSGPAEFAGAKITQDFFQQMAPRLK